MKRLSGKQGIKNQDRPMVCLHGAILSRGTTVDDRIRRINGDCYEDCYGLVAADDCAWTSMLGVIRLLRDCAPHDQCGQIVGHRGILQIV